MTFLEYFDKNVTKIKLIDKKRSPLMKTINGLITVGNKLGISDIADDPKTDHDESFMGGYGTTIGKKIYESPAWTWDKEPSTHVLHELTHVLQYSTIMALRYVFSSQWRMYYESECVQAEIMFAPEINRDERWMARQVLQFRGYGCNEGMIRRMILDRMEEVTKGEPREDPARVYGAYLKWKEENETEG